MSVPADTPNPGSPEAREQGCVCPRYDNRHGAGWSLSGEPPLFIIRASCPLHGKEAKP